MKLLLKVCSAIIASNVSLYAQSFRQEIKFSNITSSQGLSQNTINCVIQDRKGFLWIGTNNGLNRYDGYKFRIYKNELGNQNSLSNNYIVALHEDTRGNIWVGTYGGGLNLFNPNTENFIRYQHKKNDPNSIASNDIRAFHEDEEGKIWLGLYGGNFSYFNPATQTFKRFPLDPRRKYPKPNRVLTLIPDKKQGFWVGTMTGLFYFDRQQGTYTKHFWVYKNSQAIGKKNMVYHIFRDRVTPRILWLCTIEAGLVKFDTYTNKIVKRWEANPTDSHSLRTNAVMSFHQDQKGDYWVGSKKGFYKFTPESDKFMLLPSDPQNPRKIAGNNIQRIFEDKAGTLWLCSYEHGISTFNPCLTNFGYYAPIEKTIRQISSFCEDHKNNIWFGTKGGTIGLVRFNQKNNTIKTFKPDPENPQSIASNEVNILLTDVDGSIWIGTVGQGLNHYDSKTEKFEHYLPNIHDTFGIPLRSPNIGALYQDQNKPNELWVGTRGYGLFKFSKKEQRFVQEYIHKKYYNGTKISHATIIAITKDYKGNLWLATRNGLSRLNLRSNSFTNYFHSVNDPHSISGNYVSALHIDQQNILWIGTHNGLNKINLKEVYEGKARFKHYTVKQGLSNDIIHKIIEDTQGILWLSTSRGLSRFDKKQETFNNYDERDGLQGNEFSTNSGLLTKKGAVLMGGTNGFNLFYPHSIRKNNYAPPVVFTDFQIFNKPVSISKKGALTRPIWSADTLNLSFKDKLISFEFAALNYVLPQKNTYAVFMENYDQAWRHIGHKQKETYANISPGTYIFRVKATNNDGVWSKKEARIVVVVSAAWWQTNWFKMSLALVIIMLLAGGFQLRRRLIKRQEAFHQLSSTCSSNTTQKIEKKEQPVASPPKKILKNQEEITQLKQKLHEVVVKQELYKEEAISLTKIAEKMAITDKKLSELLNKELDSSFYDYINTCKINAFKERVAKGDARHLKLISIAYESGFHSKATFNRIFKKYTGLTPSEYKKKTENTLNP